jgi:protein tyrosine/serine phosphatase
MHLKRRLVCTFALAAFVTLLPSPPTTVQATEGPLSTPAADVSNIKIRNFGQVNANYYRGAQPEDRDYPALAALGVRTVIDLQADGDNVHEAQLVEAAGMTFHRIPMFTRVAPTLEQIAQFMTIVTNPAHQPVYVHCAGGKHRTGVMTAVYRLEHDGWTPDQAYQEMKRYKFGSSNWHPEFKDFVYRYQPLRIYVPRPVRH